MVIQRRPHCSATVAVVPEPQVGSSTRSPGSVVISTQRSMTFVRRLNDIDLGCATRSRCQSKYSKSDMPEKSSIDIDVPKRFSAAQSIRSAFDKTIHARQLVFQWRSRRNGTVLPSELEIAPSIVEPAAGNDWTGCMTLLQADTASDAVRCVHLAVGSSRLSNVLNRRRSFCDSVRSIELSNFDRHLVSAYQRCSRNVRIDKSLFARWSSERDIADTKFSVPNTSSISARTRCTFSSPICTKMLPLSCSRSRATVSRSRR